MKEEMNALENCTLEMIDKLKGKILLIASGFSP